MLFLANENVPLASIKRLRLAAYSIAAIVEESPGVSDEKVLFRAAKEKRIILTFDRDYGELIYKRKLPVPHGLVYFRFVPTFPEEPALLFLKILENSNIPLDGKFTIIERDKIRQRPL